MANLIKYVGTYQYSNKLLTNSKGLKLLIANRSNVSKTKTPLFLIDKTLPVGKYVSSLYPLSKVDTFRFDFKGVGYTLKLDSTKEEAIITQNQSPLYINRTL